ncbi:hypothetical protein E8E14_009608 [Neopestalotiopsis sp. 37M]|nr:hypothetical protein E8E14_009608 [Neopestalotiopsis sp. 37M]
MPHALKHRLGDTPAPVEPGPFVRGLYDILTGGQPDLEKAVDQARSLVPGDLAKCKIINAESFLSFAQGMLMWTPSESVQGRDIYLTLCVFYFVMDQDPVGQQQTAINPSQIQDGQPIITELSQWIIDFAKQMGQYMDTPASLTQESYQSFMRSAPYNLSECQYVENDPTGGFNTFNALFSRYVKEGTRPIYKPHDDTQIVFPADSTLDDIRPVDLDSDNSDVVILKNLPWKISDLLDNSNIPSGVDFNGGVWMHAFLGPNDYHRQHAPVRGKVIHASVIPGLTYLNVVAEPDDSIPGSPTRLRPVRPIANDVDAPDDPGYQFMQARGCIIIETESLGYVAVLPIGMAQVSSVIMEDSIANATPACPVKVKKGDPISYFKFGGSDIVVVFQAQANIHVSYNTVSFTGGATGSRPGQGEDDYYPGQHGRVGELLAIANPQPS